MAYFIKSHHPPQKAKNGVTFDACYDRKVAFFWGTKKKKKKIRAPEPHTIGKVFFFLSGTICLCT